MLTSLITLSAPSASAAVGCRVDYTVNDWGSGFTATVRINNLGDPVNGWTLRFAYAGNQRVTAPGWSANWSQSGQQVTATNLSWNANLATGGSTEIGFNGTYSGTNAAPTSFSLNGTTCTGTTDPDPDPDPDPPGNRVDNPYVGAKVYVNPDWAAKANAEPGGSRIANQPTAVWLDRIAAINGTSTSRGLVGHLDEAVRQAAGQPLVIQLVIYNLPGRDCAALASNGELSATDLPRYKTEYIDPIAAILARPAYANLRIVTVVEIDSLPNLVTNVSPRPTATANCDTMKANGNYVNGVGYALAKLGAVPNVYNYVDAGHHGWLGWDDNFNASVQIICQAASASGSTPANVHGFIANTANYSALKEPFFTATTVVGGRPLREVAGGWVDWNRYVDELGYAQAFRQQADSQCFDSGVGMLIDTSRNGWGGP
ncbi:MAG: glycoside hydrolase family 6 protein, partial [Actinomycetota bacterium]|nr:glycoside hydrolase family 6 protein [Actinomycetota bacterium]